VTGPVLRQLVAVIDSRTTVICLDCAGQVRSVGEPYDTLAGQFDEPPFHVHCRSVSVPYLTGMDVSVRSAAAAELATRSARQIATAARVPGPVAVPPGPLGGQLAARVARWLLARKRRGGGPR
jgi:hypothetical protein